ncbi:MAG: site-2 protease family protein [Solirubrobacteraceae bacterium]
MLRRTNSVRLFSVFGIRVGADLSWFIALFLLIYLLSSPFKNTLHSSEAVAYLTTVISVLLLFGSLIVHEFGHALVARRQGIGVDHIDLYLFGGLTRMNRDAATPGEDFKVSAAGPLATLGVILVCLALDLAIVGPHRLTHAIALDQDITITPVLLSLSWLLPMNVLLLVFNLMPAYPLDGGRIARAIVWRVTGSKRTGTIISSRMGQGLSLVLAAFGLWLLLNYGTFAGLWAIALAFMTYQAARSAVYQSALDERIEGVRVVDIMDAHPVAIGIETGLQQALDEYFLRYGWSWFPATDEHGRYAGIVTQERTQASIDSGVGWLTIASVVDAERTGSWRVEQDRPITDLIGSESLGLLGAVMAVDGDGVLRGVVTVQQLRRAMQSALSPSA